MSKRARLKAQGWGAWATGNFGGGIYKFRQAKKEFKDNPSILLEIVKGIMLCQSCLGQTENALRTAQEGLQILKTRTGDIPPMIACKFLHNYSVALSKEGEYKEALRLLKKALSDADRDFRAKVLQGMGIALSNLGRHKAAVKKFDRALEEKTNTVTRLFLLEQKATALHEMRKYAKAVRELKKVVRKRSRLKMPRDWTYFHLASSLEASGRLKDALKYYIKAAGSCDSLISRVQKADYRKSFFAQKLEIFARLVDLAVRLKEYDKAYFYARLSKGKVFREQMLKKRSGNRDLKEEKKLRRKMEELSKGDFDPAKLAALEKKYRQVRKRIEKAGGMESFFKDPLKTSRVRALLGKKQALLDFYCLEDTTLVFSVTRERLKVHRLRTGYRKVSESAGSLRDAALKRGNEANFRWYSGIVYRRLLKTALGALKGETSLLISPHRAIHLLPFCALAAGKGSYLGEKYRISYVPSPLALEQIRERGDGSEGENKSFLGVADSRGDLPGARREVDILGGHFEKSKLLKGNRATLPGVHRHIGGKNIIHFACHGVFDTDNPLNSHIKLKELKNHPGKLTASQIAALNLKKAECAVLSACSTALGAQHPGDDWDGLSRSLLMAGCRSTVSCLWDIPDFLTARLMEKFYENLHKEGPSGAMKSATVEIMKKFPHPFYWGAFKVTGDW